MTALHRVALALAVPVYLLLVASAFAGIAAAPNLPIQDAPRIWPPQPALKPTYVEVSEAPAWSVTAEHALCFKMPDKQRVLWCLSEMDRLVEVGAE